MRLVLVKWLDSSSFKGIWNNINEIKDQLEPTKCRSVGWILVDKKDFIVLVPHLTNCNEQGSGDMTIPKRAIVKITVLRKKG